MKINVLNIIDFEKVDVLLEGFNKTTGFVTAILDLEGNVLSKSGWRQMCTHFHRVNPETSKMCTISDTVLAGKMAEGEKYHFYKCLNGLVDVAVPIIINDEHIANLFSGQFFFERPDPEFFKKQAKKYGFDEKNYLEAFNKVPVVSKEEVKIAMDFSLNMTRLISDLAFQKLEQMELNLTIRANEERQRMILQTAMDGFWMVDLNGKFIEVNDVACKMVGYTRKEMLKLGISDLEAEETAEQSQKHIQKILEIGEDRFESKHRCKNSEIIDVELSVKFQPDHNLIVVFIRDVTDRKLAEEALLEIENSVRKKLNAILLPEGNLEILGLEEILNIPAVSEIMENIFKMTGIAVALGDLKGNALVAFGWQVVCTQFHRTHPVACKNCTESDTFLASQVEPGTFKLYKCKNNMWDLVLPIHVGSRHVGNIFVGQFFFEDEVPELETFKSQAKQFGFNKDEYLLALERVPRVSRETVNAIANFYTQFSSMISSLSYSSIQFARIVNEQKQTEDKIKQLNKELEQRVFESTDQLKVANRSRQSLLSVLEDQRRAQQELNKLNAELEQRVIERTLQLELANKELESFSYSVSHDLRAPLRGIDGFSLALFEDYHEKLDDSAKNYIERIRLATKKMDGLIDSLLKLSRISRFQMNLETINLSTIVLEITSELKELAKSRKSTFIIQKDITIFADSNLMKIALENLVNNAWKFTSKNENTIIEFGGFVENSQSVYFVKDNGIGFDMKYADKLFSAFQRLHSEKEFPGTGIGLTTVQRIIRRHNGIIWAESKQNEGTTFYFTL